MSFDLAEYSGGCCASPESVGIVNVELVNECHTQPTPYNLVTSCGNKQLAVEGEFHILTSISGAQKWPTQRFPGCVTRAPHRECTPMGGPPLISGRVKLTRALRKTNLLPGTVNQITTPNLGRNLLSSNS